MWLFSHGWGIGVMVRESDTEEVGVQEPSCALEDMGKEAFAGFKTFNPQLS